MTKGCISAGPPRFALNHSAMSCGQVAFASRETRALMRYPRWLPTSGRVARHRPLMIIQGLLRSSTKAPQLRHRYLAVVASCSTSPVGEGRLTPEEAQTISVIVGKRAELFPSIELASEIEALKSQLAAVVGTQRAPTPIRRPFAIT